MVDAGCALCEHELVTVPLSSAPATATGQGHARGGRWSLRPVLSGITTKIFYRYNKNIGSDKICMQSTSPDTRTWDHATWHAPSAPATILQQPCVCWDRLSTAWLLYVHSTALYCALYCTLRVRCNIGTGLWLNMYNIGGTCNLQLYTYTFLILIFLKTIMPLFSVDTNIFMQIKKYIYTKFLHFGLGCVACIKKTSIQMLDYRDTDLALMGYKLWFRC